MTRRGFTRVCFEAHLWLSHICASFDARRTGDVVDAAVDKAIDAVGPDVTAFSIGEVRPTSCHGRSPLLGGKADVIYSR